MRSNLSLSFRRTPDGFRATAKQGRKDMTGGSPFSKQEEKTATVCRTTPHSSRKRGSMPWHSWKRRKRDLERNSAHSSTEHYSITESLRGAWNNCLSSSLTA